MDFLFSFFFFPREAVMKLQTETIKLSPGVKFAFFFLFFFTWHTATQTRSSDWMSMRIANSEENQKASIIRWERQTVPMLLISVWEAWSLAFFESADLYLSARNCIKTGQRTAARSHSLSKRAFPKSRSREKCPPNCSVGGCELLGLFMFLRQRNTQRWRRRLHMIIFNN